MNKIEIDWSEVDRKEKILKDKFKNIGELISKTENYITKQPVYMIKKYEPCKFCGSDIFIFEEGYIEYCDNCSKYVCEDE